ncbi:MAG: phosphatase PAP2 family protein [Flavobacteriaceae bacterium]|jgi:undecaprenyl-diphosphatase|nr:phosphatase PAP2 family protein [Flavobacteriaceae bacterium]
MLETLVSLDKQLLIYLNGLGSEQYDALWLLITKQLNWIPFYLVLVYCLIKKVSIKTFGVVILTLAALIAFTDQSTNLIKWYVARPRPCNTADIISQIRIVKCSDTLSFFSGHASNSTATMVFMFLILRRFYKYSWLIFLFPLIFAYSRIYLTMHFPGDILAGMLFGICTGTLFYKIFCAIERKYSSKL